MSGGFCPGAFYRNAFDLEPRCAQCRIKLNLIFRFLLFFLSYGWFCIQNLLKNRPILSTETTRTQKIKIRELTFNSFQHIAHLPCKSDNFWARASISCHFLESLSNIGDKINSKHTLALFTRSGRSAFRNDVSLRINTTAILAIFWTNYVKFLHEMIYRNCTRFARS